MVGIRDYSPTAASNLSVGGISIAEGMARASVNNALRSGYADLANLLLDQGGGATTTGSANAYLLNLPTAPTAYADNLLFVCKLHAAVTGASTININGLGVKALKKLQDGVATALAAGDGPVGHRPVCVYSSSENAVLMLLTAPTFTHTGGEAWPIQDRMKEQVYLLDFIPQSEHAAIRAGTSTYDCSDAMDDAMACITVPSDNPGFYEGGAEIIFPYGTCYFTRTIELKKTLTLQGHGIGGRNGWQSRLLFAPNITGITVNSLTGFEGDLDPPVFPIPVPPHSMGGDAATIRGLKLSSQSLGIRNPALNDTGFGVGHGIGHGIWCRSRANIQQCIIQYFPQHGLYVRAAAVVTDTPDGRAIYGNANNMYVAQVCCLSNGGCGMYIDGPDTNAGLFMGMDFGSNKLSAIHESSLIGNVHIMPHTDNNGTQACCSYRDAPGVTGIGRYYTRDASRAGTIPPVGHADSEDVWGFMMQSTQTVSHPSYPDSPDNNQNSYPAWPNATDGITPKDYEIGYNYWFDQVSAPNVLIGPYTEGGQPFSLIVAPSIVIGILNYDDATTAVRLQGGSGYALIEPAIKLNSKTGSARDFVTDINIATNESLRWTADGDHSNGLGFGWDETNGVWRYIHANNTGRVPMGFSTQLTTLTGGRADVIGPGNTIHPQGIWLGRHPTYLRHFTMAEVMPTTGQWAAGDLVLNALPLMGEPWGWRCILTGDFAATPPVFQPLRDTGSQQTISDGSAFTLTPGTSPHRTLYSGTMAANRTVTLSTASALIGLSYRITRTASGAFSLNVGTGPLKALAQDTWCEVAYDGSAYYLSAFGSL